MLDIAPEGERQHRSREQWVRLSRVSPRFPHVVSSLRLPIPGLALAFALGIAARLAIIPLTHGHDFAVWDVATRLILRGVNPYTHWQAMPNAYPYLPVFLYVLLPLQWLSMHTGLPFAILGKLPIVAADLAVAAVLYRWVLRSGRSSRAAVAAAGIYLFNPLVLYNSAFLGRFDAVALAFLLPSLGEDGPRFAIPYGLAVATKTFPIFILPALVFGRFRRSTRELVGAAAVVLVVAIPFLLWDPAGLVGNLTVRLASSSVPAPRGLSWQYVLQSALPAVFARHVATISYGVSLIAFLVVILLWRDRPPISVCALTFGAFLLVDRKIWEQYLTWTLPFLIALAIVRRDVIAWLLFGGMTLAALFMNEQRAPVDHRFYFALGPYPPLLINVLLALGIVFFIVHSLWPLRPASDRAELSALP